MNSRDEKAAFDAMMDEIENDDSDNDQYGMKNKNVRGSISYQSQPKRNSNFNKPHSQMKHINDLEYKNQGATNRRGGDDFDNSHQLQSEIDNFGSTAGNAIQNEAEIKKAELVELKRFLTRPCRPNEPPLKLYVERDRGGFNMLSPVYRLYLEAPNNNANEVADSKRTPADTCVNGRFLMYATKQLNSKTSSYLFSCEPNSASNTIDDRGAEYIVGKLKGNAVGSQYMIVDNGRSPEKATGPSMLRKEYGVLRFEFDSGGPSVVEAWVPSCNASGSIVNSWQPKNNAGSMNTYIESYLSNAAMTNGSGNAPGKLNPSDYDNLLMLRNKRPVWDAHHGGHVLNFHGRVTKSSVKNFQLCIEKNWFIKHLHSSASNTTNKKNHHHSDDEEDFEEYKGSPSSPCPFNDVILQFGKIASDKFTMDVQYPLSIYQAYAICIACMDGKLADRKGYEYIKKLTGYNGNNNGSHSTDTSEEKSIQGNMTGAKTFAGSIMESIPSAAYIAEKFKRSSING